MTAELPKVVWMDPDAMRRAVLVAVSRHENGVALPMVDFEAFQEDALGVAGWHDVDEEFALLWAAEVIADLSGVKWRETSGDG